MSAIQIPTALIDVPAPFSIASSACSAQSRFTLPLIPGTSTRLPPRTLRDRCNFTLWLALSPSSSATNPSTTGFPAKGELGPSAGNLPRRRKRSSVVPLEIPAPAPVLKEKEVAEYFAAPSSSILPPPAVLSLGLNRQGNGSCVPREFPFSIEIVLVAVSFRNPGRRCAIIPSSCRQSTFEPKTKTHIHSLPLQVHAQR
ncbi:hypothetical protein B0H11DRAFT_1947692 [Mycena galericulata]|nr:hypothetical protein B0H11DRAFT_1947692 [Mycena galericulata]